MNGLLDWVLSRDPVTQSLLAGLLTWAMTAFAASLVLIRQTIARWLLDTMLGFAAGVMIAASVWSLLVPSIEIARETGTVPWLPATIGVLAGAASLRLVDRLLPHLHLFSPCEAAEGIRTQWRRTTLLVLAITLHNFPEGLAVGVAFGATKYVTDPTLALSLTSGAFA